MAFRKVKPGAADLGLSIVRKIKDERLIHAYMPVTLPRMRLWLRCLESAGEWGKTDFMEWVAKHALEIDGRPEVVLASLGDVIDWVLACYRADESPSDFDPSNPLAGPYLPCGEQFVVRQFRPNMSLKTVLRLSSDWHEAVATNISGRSYVFPEPWCDGGEVLGYTILPIVNAADLYREGRTMHHCVGTYSQDVLAGRVYLYTVRKGSEPIGTVELVRHDERVSIGQIRGLCNAQVGIEVQRAVNEWVTRQREFKLPEVSKAKSHDDDEIPF